MIFKGKSPRWIRYMAIGAIAVGVAFCVAGSFFGLAAALPGLLLLLLDLGERQGEKGMAKFREGLTKKSGKDEGKNQ